MKFFILTLIFLSIPAPEKLIQTEKRYEFTKDKSEMILPFSEAFKTKISGQTLLNFYRSVL